MLKQGRSIIVEGRFQVILARDIDLEITSRQPGRAFIALGWSALGLIITTICWMAGARSLGVGGLLTPHWMAIFGSFVVLSSLTIWFNFFRRSLYTHQVERHGQELNLEKPENLAAFLACHDPDKLAEEWLRRHFVDCPSGLHLWHRDTIAAGPACDCTATPVPAS